MTYVNFDIYFLEFDIALHALKSKERLSIWRTFSGLGYIKLLESTRHLLIDDIKEFPELISSSLIDWIILIMSGEHRLTEREIEIVDQIIAHSIDYIPELKIVKLYLDTYRSYFVGGNKTAMFSLPKEQRLFFSSKILNNQDIKYVGN